MVIIHNPDDHTTLDDNGYAIIKPQDYNQLDSMDVGLWDIGPIRVERRRLYT